MTESNDDPRDLHHREWMIQMHSDGGYTIYDCRGDVAGKYANPNTAAAHHAFALQELVRLRDELKMIADRTADAHGRAETFEDAVQACINGWHNRVSDCNPTEKRK